MAAGIFNEGGSCVAFTVPLDATCAPLSGGTGYRTVSFAKVELEMEREDPIDLSTKNMNGQFCSLFQLDAVDKWLNVEFEMCLTDWEFIAATGGHLLGVDPQNVPLAFQYLMRGNDKGCAPEAKPVLGFGWISTVANQDDGCATGPGEKQCMMHYLPHTTDWQWDIKSAINEPTYVKGRFKAYRSPNPGLGPFNLWPGPVGQPELDPNAIYAEWYIPCADVIAETGNYVHP